MPSAGAAGTRATSASPAEQALGPNGNDDEVEHEDQGVLELRSDQKPADIFDQAHQDARQEGAADVPETIVTGVKSVAPEEFVWDQAYITEVPPIMMSEPYFSIFGQSQEPIPYYYEEAVRLAGHSCGAITGAWTITKKALEILYPEIGRASCRERV